MGVPILICIPYWMGDKAQAMNLCKIITGLQPHHVGVIAHVLLIARQDCSIDQNMVKIISQKFNTFTYKSSSPLKGWPNGANGIFASTMIHISNNAVKNYECVFWMEPDCIPTRPNWFWDLVIEWRRRHPKANIVGCRADCNGDGTGDHITGCALYHPNIARILPEITHCDGMAWDYQHRAKIVAMGGSIKLLQNRYKETKVDPGIIEEPGVCLIHGIKDDSLLKAVAKKFSINLS